MQAHGRAALVPGGAHLTGHASNGGVPNNPLLPLQGGIEEEVDSSQEQPVGVARSASPAKVNTETKPDEPRRFLHASAFSRLMVHRAGTFSLSRFDP